MENRQLRGMYAFAYAVSVLSLADAYSIYLVAPFEYTALIWGVALDWFIWHLLPERRLLAGAMVVVGSGLYVIYRENRGQARA